MKPMPQKWWLVRETVTVVRTYRVSAPTEESAILSAKDGEDEKPDVYFDEDWADWQASEED